MYERFTDRARKAMQLANMEAQKLNHTHIGPEHILLGILREGSGIACQVLKNLGVDLDCLLNKVRGGFTPFAEMIAMGKLPQTAAGKWIIECSIREAKNLNHNYVGTEHLLAALADCDEPAGQSLRGYGVTLMQVREEIRKIVSVEPAGLDEGIKILLGMWVGPVWQLVEPGDEQATAFEKLWGGLTAKLEKMQPVDECKRAMSIVREEMEAAKAAGQTAVACALLKVARRIEELKP